jgi:hypothetical protein
MPIPDQTHTTTTNIHMDNDEQNTSVNIEMNNKETELTEIKDNTTDPDYKPEKEISPQPLRNHPIRQHRRPARYSSTEFDINYISIDNDKNDKTEAETHVMRHNWERMGQLFQIFTLAI